MYSIQSTLQEIRWNFHSEIVHIFEVYVNFRRVFIPSEYIKTLKSLQKHNLVCDTSRYAECLECLDPTLCRLFDEKSADVVCV